MVGNLIHARQVNVEAENKEKAKQFAYLVLKNNCKNEFITVGCNAIEFNSLERKEDAIKKRSIKD